MNDTERRRLYRKVFNSKDGKELMADLVATFDADGPSFIPIQGGDRSIHYDPLHAALIDGQKQTVKHCRNFSAPEKKTTKPTVTKRRTQ
tara:strand:+ start:7440 stop:7706 length:267 start_codon:yes stop_codon:yes gene_type:complete